MSRTLDRSQLELDKMPNVGDDPVVESGSNADGEWTRWADGTQACRMTVTNSVSLNTSNGRGLFGSWAFAIAFSGVPDISFTQVRPHGDYLARSATFGTSSAGDALSPTTTGSIVISIPGATFQNVSWSCSIITTGRWK